jgi:hypothetical protein
MPAMPVFLGNDAEACVANYLIDDGLPNVRHMGAWPLSRALRRAAWEFFLLGLHTNRFCVFTAVSSLSQDLSRPGHKPR